MLDLILKDSINITYRLSSNKTYMEMPDPQLDYYRIKYLRDEKINNSNCKVVKVATHDTNNYSIILWITDEIMHYDTFMVGSVNSIDYVKLKSALNEQNISGLPVIIQYGGSESSYEYLLKSFGDYEIDLSLFSLEGYTTQKPKTVDELFNEGKINEKQKRAMEEEQKKMMEKYMK